MIILVVATHFIFHNNYEFITQDEVHHTLEVENLSNLALVVVSTQIEV